MLERIWLKFLTIWWGVIVPWRLRRKGVTLGRDVRFYGMPIISMIKGSSIRIGDRVVLCSDSRFTALGVNHPVILRTLQSSAAIEIGADCGISGGAICSAQHVELGKGCLIGANVTIVDTDFHPIDHPDRRYCSDFELIAVEGVHIGENVFVGTGATILKGAKVAQNSVVGAGAVVVKGAQVQSVLAGNPAKIVKCLQ